MKTRLSDKDEEVNTACEKLHHEVDELRTNLEQIELDRDNVVRENSALTDKVSLDLQS